MFNFKIDNITKEEALKKVGFFSADSEQHYIVCPYSEFVARAYKDVCFRDIVNNADLSLCDGWGLAMFSKLAGGAAPEQIAGVDFVDSICGRFSNIFLFGGRKDIVQKVADRYKGNIADFSDGYRNKEKIIDEINKVKPAILIVALGMPVQEKWIVENLKKMPSVKLAIGVGGAFDFLSGQIRRAPLSVQKVGMEWLWRFCRQPWRARRIYSAVIVFPWLILSKKVRIVRSDL